jgi:hypothetical protein
VAERRRVASATGRGERDDRGVALVEFVLVLPLTVLILFALIDFGLIFNGYSTMRNGVQAGARLASVNNYSYAGSSLCNGGSTDPTSQMVCTVTSSIGSLYGVVPGSLHVGIALTSVMNAGQSGQNVTVCASGTLNSTTGLLGKLLLGQTMKATSKVLVVQAPNYTSYGSGSGPVTYGSVAVGGMACST